ncbi:MAG: glycosyltransferase family 1 protein [Marinibacterium sp.]|nr:glycosyltransferase family 1 protein [Marinibacterium sp.]
MVTDPRFSGGTSAAVIADVMAMADAGARIALVPVASHFFDGAPDRPNAALLALADLDAVTLCPPGDEVSAQLAFFHQPLSFHDGVAQGSRIRAAKSVVVAHHPAFRGDGSLEYSPLRVNRMIAAQFGCQPLWAPVSGQVRRQLRSFSPLIRLTASDWVNRFDPSSWRATRPVFDGGSAVVGRHGRADPLKWPDRARDITAPLSPGPGWQTRVLGCPDDALQARGADVSRWDRLDFGSVAVPDFLNGIDVFCYFHSDRWVEAFGRTVIEAMLMERPCVLDPRLEPTFGAWAQYAPAAQAAQWVRALREIPDRTRQACRTIRDEVAQSYASRDIPQQFQALLQDPGTRARSGPKRASPLVTLRKSVGLARRRAARTARCEVPQR